MPARPVGGGRLGPTPCWLPVMDPRPAAPLGPHVVLVPVKAFRRAKVRLAPALAPERRAELARAMASRVVAAGTPLPVAVVCDDPEVASWARSLGALVIWQPGRGLNPAVDAGVRCLAAAGAARVTVAHGDLPLASNLARLGDQDREHLGDPRAGLATVTLVPDRRLDGTNVASVPTGTGFRFSYGAGSLRRHWQEALRRGLAVDVVREPLLAWDVDIPDDLSALSAPQGGGRGLGQA